MSTDGRVASSEADGRQAGSDASGGPAEDTGSAPNESVQTAAPPPPTLQSDAAFRPWPAGRPRRARAGSAVAARARARESFRAPSTPLTVLLLVVLAWSLPFYEPPQPEAGDSFLAVPFARSGRPLVAAPVLRIDARAVTLDGRLLASSHDVVEHGEAALGLLGRDLETLQRNWRLLHRDVPPPGRLCVEASGATRWEVLRPVLLAAARAGYPHMAFIVRSGPFGAPPFDWARFAPTPREP